MSTQLTNPSTAPLSDEDGRRLKRFFELHEDLIALADDLAAPLVELLAWINQPQIAAAIELIDRYRKNGQALAAAHRSLDAASEAEGSAEIRRCANTALRALRPPAARRTHRAADASSTQVATGDTWREAGPRTQDRLNSSSPPPTPAPRAGTPAAPSSQSPAPARSTSGAQPDTVPPRPRPVRFGEY
jgi:hypothetical protein